MEMQFEGTLKLVQEGRPFTDKETGEVTPAKFSCYFQCETADDQPQVVVLKAKKDFSKYIDYECVVTVALYPQRDNSGFWASITELKPAQGSDIR